MDITSNERTLDAYLHEQALRSPDSLAIVNGSRCYSFVDLNDRVSHLAAELVKILAGRQRRVAVHIEDKLDGFLAMLALFRAACVYVPIDKLYPLQRCQYIVTDSEIDYVITDAAGATLWARQQLNAICLAEGAFVAECSYLQVKAPRLASLAVSNCPAVAYILYTSGSTGNPKGVEMPHRAVINLIDYQLECAQGFERPLRTLQFASPGFDVSCQEVISSIAGGGPLIIVPAAVRADASRLYDFLGSEQIERAFLPYSVLQTLAIEAERQASGNAVRLQQLITAGEQLLMSKEIVSWLTAMNCRLINHYGPTETHVVTSFSSDLPLAEWPYRAPIGTPIHNVKVTLLDEHNRPVSDNSVGMLYISGPCLANGYINLADAQSERFLWINSSEGLRERAYKTGDLARKNAQGEIVYEGRIDTQVKLNGYRVELDEIEIVLKARPEVKEAIVKVVALGDGSSSSLLTAFLVLNDEKSHQRSNIEEAPAASFRSWCSELPEYMVPRRFYTMGHIPLTTNGKVDHLALEQAGARVNDVEADRFTLQEHSIAVIFSRLLRCKDVHPSSDFFESGGNSLLAVRFIKALEQELAVRLSLTEFLRKPTIAHVASLLTTEKL